MDTNKTINRKIYSYIELLKSPYNTVENRLTAAWKNKFSYNGFDLVLLQLIPTCIKALEFIHLIRIYTTWYAVNRVSTALINSIVLWYFKLLILILI